MPSVTIRITGVDKAVERLGALTVESNFTAAVQEALDKIESQLATYPGPSQSFKMSFRGGGQSVRARARSGRIRPPYRRTGNLKRSWNKTMSSPLAGKVYSPLDYARYVQGKEGQQALKHAGRWKTVDDIARGAAGIVQDIFRRRLEAVARRL